MPLKYTNVKMIMPNIQLIALDVNCVMGSCTIKSCKIG